MTYIIYYVILGHRGTMKILLCATVQNILLLRNKIRIFYNTILRIYALITYMCGLQSKADNIGKRDLIEITLKRACYMTIYDTGCIAQIFEIFR